MNVRSNRPSSLDPEEFARLQHLVESELGVLVPAGKRPMLQSRLARRCRELGFDTVRDYCAYLFGEGVEAGESVHFFDAVTTNYTYFYREPEQLEHVLACLPELAMAAAAERRALGIWSAACSTGEEAWTLAMMADHAATGVRAPFDVHLCASDVSTRVLELAARAVYRRQDLDRLPVEWRDRYFMKSKRPEEDRVRVVARLRGWATFQRLNLMDAAYPVATQQDLVFLRNVLIYFDADTRYEVLSRIARHVRPGGLLVLGTSESLAGLDLPFEHVKRSIFRKEMRVR